MLLFLPFYHSGACAPPTNTDTDLQKWIDQVPNLIGASRAERTKDKYQRAWKKWEAFCQQHRIRSRPADPFNIAVYFNYLLSARGTRGAITDAMYGIRWGHISAGLHTPTDHPFTKLAYDGAIRSSNYTGTKKKEPFTATMLRALVDADRFTDYMYFRFVIICSLGFTSFMRLDEILHVKIEHIQFHQDHLTINLPKSKTDQTREGNIIYLAELGTKYCPVINTAIYIHTLKLKEGDYLICKLAKSKAGHNPIGKHQMSGSHMRKVFQQHISTYLPHTTNITPHSLRAGGASAAAENGVPDRQISKHGRWKSENARNGYILDTVQNRLEISKKLGL